ncbi:MAG: AMP-binding enzyme, partial [bacterium]
GVRLPMMEAARVHAVDGGAPVPADGATVGEILLRGNTTMKGYYKNPEATRAAFDGGWFHSGDLAVVHADGYIEIKDRLKDIIISGGENISSIEVESALYKHPKIAAAAVVAKPDPKWGESPCAFVELQPDESADADEIIAFCRQHLSGFKRPKQVVFMQLPKTSTGKIQKFRLRELVREGAV